MLTALKEGFRSLVVDTVLGKLVAAVVAWGVMDRIVAAVWQIPTVSRQLLGLALFAVVYAGLLWFVDSSTSATRRGSRPDRRVRERLLVLFRAHGEPAYTEVSNLVATIARSMERSFEDSHNTVSALLLDGKETRDARLQTLRDTLNNRRLIPQSDTLQKQVGQFCEDYEWCVRWVNFAGRLSRYPATLPAFPKWREADAAFLLAIKETVALDEMETLATTLGDGDYGKQMRQQIEARASEVTA